MKEVMNSIKKWMNLSDSVCEIKDIARGISSDVKNLQISHDTYLASIAEYKRKLEESEMRRQHETQLFLSVIDNIEDMIWAKDMDGKYIMANKAFRDKFCYGMRWSELRGKTDSELNRMFKQKVGSDNHTFAGCFESDRLVHVKEESIESLEQGLIDGKLVKLVVNKSPVYDFEGVMFATCGTGKDVTEWHDDLKKAIVACNSCFGNQGKELLLAELEKIEFR